MAFRQAPAEWTSVEEALKEAEDYANGLLDDYWADKE